MAENSSDSGYLSKTWAMAELKRLASEDRILHQRITDVEDKMDEHSLGIRADLRTIDKDVAALATKVATGMWLLGLFLPILTGGIVGLFQWVIANTVK